MNLLFFDLEYATSKGGKIKICEFGYVLTDENFSVLKRDNYIINPNIAKNKWDSRVVDEILTRSIDEYKVCPTFDKYYNDIDKLLKGADLVFGHSLDGDAKALNDECKRYKLPSIDFEFYDVKKIYKIYKNDNKEISVIHILDELNIVGEEREHDAETDAYNTMLCLKGVLGRVDATIKDVSNLYVKVKDENKNYEVESARQLQIQRAEILKKLKSGECGNVMKRGSYANGIFRQFAINVQPTIEQKRTLQDIKFSIGVFYEEYHYKQMLNIVQLLCNLGATYTFNTGEADYFVRFDAKSENGEQKECPKLKHVISVNEKGGNVKIITFDKFLQMIGITENQLDNMPMVSFKCLYRKDAQIKDHKISKLLHKRVVKEKPKEKIYQSQECTYTLGDKYIEALAKLNFGSN